MKLSLSKSTKVTNFLLAAVATLAIAGFKKDFGIMNLLLCFFVAFFLLFMIDVFHKFANKKLNKKLMDKKQFIKKNSKV